MNKKGKKKKRYHSTGLKDDHKSRKPQYVLKPGIDLSKRSGGEERLDITETDEDENEGVGDGKIGQNSSDFEHGLRDG